MNRILTLKHVLAAYLCVTVVVVVAAGMYASYTMRTLYIDRTEKDLEARARLCFHHVADLLEQDDTAAVDALCKELGKAVNTRITVVRPTGEVIGDTQQNPQEMETHKNRPEIKEALESPDDVGQAIRFSDTLEKKLMYVAVTLRREGEPVAVVRTSTPINTVNKRLDLIDRYIIVVGFVAIVLIVAVSPWLSLRISRPAKGQLPETT